MLTAEFEDGPRLLADIGGTNARFALEYSPGKIDEIRVLRCADYAEFSEAIAAYLSIVQQAAVRTAAVAVASPVCGDTITMTNHPWQFSVEETRRRLNFSTLLAVNDFNALAMALPYLGVTDYEQLGGEKSISSGVLGLVGAGTGLGVGGLLSVNGNWIALNSEGGHATFSPADERELAILQYCWRNYRHVSAERLVSGPGIALIHEALSAIDGAQNDKALETAEIVRRALVGGDALCEETVACFCAMLGTVASNVAITLGALGGLYIGGGIVPRLGKYFMHSQFRARFENKGRFREYLSKVPVYVITAQYPAFVGVAAILHNYLGNSHRP